MVLAFPTQPAGCAANRSRSGFSDRLLASQQQAHHRKAGVIDPTKVVRNALQNASSISAMILTTEAVVADFDEEKDSESPAIII